MADKQYYLCEVTGRSQHQRMSQRKRIVKYASSLVESVDRGKTLGSQLHPEHHGVETVVLFFETCFALKAPYWGLRLPHYPLLVYRQ